MTEEDSRKLLRMDAYTSSFFGQALDNWSIFDSTLKRTINGTGSLQLIT